MNILFCSSVSSNNTNKLSPQERTVLERWGGHCSNNTNKLSPQELHQAKELGWIVQIIQINLVLKNSKVYI